jgi:hypothetical protein
MREYIRDDVNNLSHRKFKTRDESKNIIIHKMRDIIDEEERRKILIETQSKDLETKKRGEEIQKWRK